MNNQVFQQNLNDKKGTQPGGPYLIQMLFKEPVEMPDKETMTAVMEQHIGSTECFCYDKKMAGFAALDHIAEFKDGTPNLNMIKSHSDHATTVLLHLVKKGSLTTCKTTDSVGAHGNIGNKSIKK